MADRGTPIPPPPRGRRTPRKTVERGGRTTIVVTRPGSDGGLGATPTVPFEDKGPTDPSPHTVNRLAGSSAAVRELTVHPAEGVVPQQMGGPLRVGGYLIFYRKVAGFHFFDLAIGEGPYDSIDQFLFGGTLTATDVGASVEVHLGTTGDTGSTLINAIEPGYAQPDNLARVVIRCTNPTQSSGPWNPFDFTCEATRGDYTDAISGFTGSTGTPIVAAYMAMATRVYSNTQLHSIDWPAARDQCTFDVGFGEERWQFAMRVDTQDTLENWVKVFLAYCMGYLRYSDGTYGVYLELARDYALNGDGEIFHFTDWELGQDDTGTIWPNNTQDAITYTRKGAEEVPTVVTVDYTDVQTVGAILTFLAASVQVPAEVDIDPAIDRVELRLTLRGITLIGRAQRMATLAYNLGQIDKDITIPSWHGAMQVLPGDRVRVGSLALLAAADAVPNAGAVDGWDEAAVTDVKLGDSPLLRLRPYRDSTYGAAISTNGPPSPPTEPPDPDEDPDCPTDLVALHSDPSEYGLIEFTPGTSPLISYYAVYDIYSGSPILVGTVDHTAPLGGDGKHHASFPALVHTDPDGDKHLEVRVKSVTFAGLFCTPGPEDDWDETGGGGEEGPCCFNESCSLVISAPTMTSIAYDALDYDRPTSLMFIHNSKKFDLTNGDFFAINAGNGAGLLVPKVAGQYYVSATIGWEENADSAYRALAFFYLRSQNGLHTTKITVTAGGSGYVTGEALTVTGGTLATGGIPLSGTIIASAGAIIGITYTDYGIGYTAVPTIGVTTVGGTGATLTAVLPAAFTIEKFNMNCEYLGGGQPILGQLICEDIMPAVNDAACPTRQHLGETIQMTRGSALMLGFMQGSGTALDLLDPTASTSESTVFEGCRMSLHRVGDTAITETYTICDPPE